MRGITRASAVALAAVTMGSGVWYATSSASPRPHHSKAAVVTPCSSTAYSLSLSFTTSGGTTTAVPVSGQVSFATGAATAAIMIPSSFPFAALAGATEQVVLVGQTLYLAVPPSLSSFVGGALWASLQLPSAISHAVDTIGRSLADWCGSTSSLLGALEARGGTATPEGSSTIGGVSVNETQVTIPAKGLAILAKVVRPIDPQIVSQAGAASVTIDVWANSSSDQLVQLSADVTGLNSALGLDNLGLLLDLSNVDQPVTISAPSPAVPLSKAMVKALIGMLGSALR